jgi:hypothetical protein
MAVGYSSVELQRELSWRHMEHSIQRVMRALFARLDAVPNNDPEGHRSTNVLARGPGGGRALPNQWNKDGVGRKENYLKFVINATEKNGW